MRSCSLHRRLLERGTDGSEENEEEVRKQNKETREKWEEKIGTCFFGGQADEVSGIRTAFKYLLEAAEDGSEIRPEEMKLEKRSDYTERVRVQYRKDGETKETMLVFTEIRMERLRKLRKKEQMQGKTPMNRGKSAGKSF